MNRRPLGLALGLLALALTSCRSSEVHELAPEPLVMFAARSASAADEASSPGPAAVPPARPTPLVFDLPGNSVHAISAWRPPSYPVPWVIRPEDHFYFARPIPSGEVNWPNAEYRYGYNFFAGESPHTGVDFGAEPGTPVLAAAPGEVVWTGYGLYWGYARVDDPYGLAVAIRHDFGYAGLPLYTVYAHMSAIDVWPGQLVQTGEKLGEVGETGHATGPHLHFEVRLGENRFFATRNPELWVVPPEGWGVLAGRVMGTFGQHLPEMPVRIESLETGQRWDMRTYARQAVVSDEIYQENFVLSDLPAGPYRVVVGFLWRWWSADIFVHAGQTNLLTYQGRYGFAIEPSPTPASDSAPPRP